jgi:hypothetical protein
MPDQEVVPTEGRPVGPMLKKAWGDRPMPDQEVVPTQGRPVGPMLKKTRGDRPVGRC